ncbi:MAG: class I SAM-dependent methyltransferase [Acidobacteriaceae bacterium]
MGRRCRRAIDWGYMGRLERGWRQVRWSLAQRGLGGTLRVVRERVTGQRGPEAVTVHPFDVEFGVDTSGFVGAWELDGKGPNQRHSNPYYGVPPSRLREALRRWKEMVEGEGRTVGEFAFVDIGCGKGRAMMIASEMEFREVDGLELSAGLAETARQNVERWREMGRARSPLQVAEGDATLADLPDGPWLIFMYNSFQAPVMRRMMQRLEEAARESSRRMYLLYVVPEQEAVVAEFPRFERLWSEVIPLSEEEERMDRVSSPEDRCSLYRR